MNSGHWFVQMDVGDNSGIAREPSSLCINVDGQIMISLVSAAEARNEWKIGDGKGLLIHKSERKTNDKKAQFIDRICKSRC